MEDYNFIKCCLILASLLTGSLSDVRLPPSITVQPEESIIYATATDVELKCEATGVPNVEYNWYKNGRKFDRNKDNIETTAKGTFYFKPATTLDEGYYQCFANNTYGTALSVVSTVRRSLLAPYVKTDTIEHTVNEGDNLEVKCLPTKSFPEPTRSWSLAEEESASGGRSIQLNERIQQDFEGNLYFANVLQSDASGQDDQGKDRVYKCAVYNQKEELTTHGSYTKVVVNTGSAASFRPSLQFSSPYNSIGLLGKTIELKCLFAGFPTPSVRWSRKGGSLPPSRTEKINYGTTLKIKDLQYTDEGEYVCEGSNSVDKQPASIILDVQAEPMFVSEEKSPHNINKTEGENVNFFCDASGEPEPKVQWYKNGGPLDNKIPGPRITISKDGKNLTVHNLCKTCGMDQTDLMVIQCNSSNNHGYAYSSGYLNVLEKTHLTIKPEDVNMLDWSDDILFKCAAVSDASTPIVMYWYFNKVQIDLARPYYEVVPEGLRIYPNKVDKDTDAKSLAGIYTCMASNIFSSESANAQLVVPDDPAPIIKEGGFALWLLILIICIAVILLIIIICCCCCLWCQRNKGDEYPVDEKERAAGRDPEKEIADGGFQDYQRPEEQPFKGSRASLTSTIKLNDSDDEGSLAEYGEPDTGKFNEDGSFIGQYTEKQKLRGGDSVV